MAVTEAERNRIKYFTKRKIPLYPYWYGMKKTLYDYVGLPSWLPASVHLQHGANTIYRHGKPDTTVLNSRYPVIFLSNQIQKDICSQYINKPIHVVGSIFPYYRQMEGIEQSETAKGTLAFPTHSTGDVSVQMGWSQYARDLKALPEKFQPVTVSLYFLDLLKGYDKIFEDEGIEVVTSGHIADEQFVANFYRHLQRFKYATGNEMGSMVYYAVEMGMPFFVYGEDPEFKNFGDKYAPSGTYKVSENYGYEKLVAAKKLFTFDNLKNVKITPEQKAFVEKSIGKHDAIPKEKIRSVILRSLPLFLLKMMVMLPYLGPKHLYKKIKARILANSAEAPSGDAAKAGKSAKTSRKDV